MRSPVTLTPLYKAILAVTLAFSVVGLGLSGALLQHYGSHMPGDALHQVTIQTLFSMAWSTLFGAIWLVGIFSLPRWFGSLLGNWTVFFLAFLQLLVASGTLVVELSKVTCSATRCASLGPAWCVQDRCNTFYGLEGVTWVVTWLTFALLVFIATEVMSRDSRRRQDDKSLKREMSRSILSPVRSRASFEQQDSGSGSSEEAANGKAKGDRSKGGRASV